MKVACRPSQRLLISCPPRHGKSEVCSKYLPAWFLGRWPDKSVIIASQGKELASRFGRSVRNILAEHGQDIFGVTLAGDSSAAHRFGLRGHRGELNAAGVGGSIVGRGADLLVVDDPVSGAEAADSVLQRQRTWDWWQQDAFTRLSPTGSVCIIQTRWHQDDLTGRLLKAEKEGGPGWDKIHLPALAGAGDTLGRQPGEPLWPEQWSAARLALTRRQIGSRAWSALYQGDPVADGSAEFPKEWFPDSIWISRFPDDLRVRTIAVDPSLGKHDKHGDYSAIVRLGVDADRMLYVDADLKRRPTTAIIDDTIRHSVAFAPQSVPFESNGFQELLAAEMRRVCQERGLFVPVRLVHHSVSKLTRIRSLAPLFEAGRVRFVHSEGSRLLVEQLQQFPTAAHDDGPDGLEMAVIEASRLLAGGDAEGVAGYIQ